MRQKGVSDEEGHGALVARHHRGLCRLQDVRQQELSETTVPRGAFRDVPGGRLYVRTFDGAGPTAVALHGFTLHGGMFGEVARRSGRRVAAPDLPGHGLTAITPIDLPTVTVALSDWITASTSPQDPVDLVGYSQGGRIALHLVTALPERFRRLLVVSASPGIADPSARETRRRRDEATADRIERVGLARFLDVWLRNPAIAPDLDPAAAAADRALRIENSAAGLAAALRGYGQGVQDDLRDRLRHLTVPATFVAGARDATYVSHTREMAALTGGDAVVVPGAGHNVVAERPDVIAELLGVA